MIRLGDLARILPVGVESIAARQAAERALDPSLIARTNALNGTKGQVSGKAVTRASKVEKTAKTKGDKPKAFSKDDAPYAHGPLADLFSFDENDEHHFDTTA